MEIQRQGAVDPVPAREVEEPGATMASMAGAEVPKTQIPRWIQLVGLPVLLLIGWTVAGAIRHVVFIFLVAALLALLLNPIVRAVGRRWIARGFAVAIVYVSFAALIILLIAAIATAVVVADAVGRESGRRLLYGRDRTASAHRRRARRRPLPALAEPPPPEAGQGPQAASTTSSTT